MNILKSLEAENPSLGEASFRGYKIWPFLRVVYNMAHINNQTAAEGKSTTKRKKIDMNRLVYGWKNWFQGYNYLFYTDSSERKRVAGEYHNKLLDYPADLLGSERVLFVEDPKPAYYPLEQVHSRRVVSSLPLKIASYFLRKLSKRVQLDPNLIKKLDDIKECHRLKVDDSAEISAFFADYRIARLMLKIYKPKAIFVSDHYSRFATVKAARDLGITVVECQHGAISNPDPIYNFDLNPDPVFYPQYLLAYGDQVTKEIKHSSFLKNTEVIPVGSFYLEQTRNEKHNDLNISSRLSGYDHIIGISLQWTVEDEVLAFIKHAAMLDDRIGYVLIPRNYEAKDYSGLGMPDNVVLFPGLNFYELIRYVDFHSSVYSTCCIEAPSLGVQNILINIGGLSKAWYGDTLNDDRVTRYVGTPEEFVETVRSFDKLDRQICIQLNEHLFKQGYMENIRRFLMTRILNESK